MAHEKLTVSSPLSSMSHAPMSVRPEGDGWMLKTTQKTWQHDKDEGKMTWVWERSSVEADA